MIVLNEKLDEIKLEIKLQQSYLSDFEQFS